VFALVPESTDVALIVIGDDGEVVEVWFPGFVKLIVCKLPTFISTYTSVAAPYVVSPACEATRVHKPVVVRLVTLKFGAAVTTATVQRSGVSEVIVTAKPVVVLSLRFNDVAVKFCVVLVNIFVVVETLMY
jgi:hypothetical protein